MSDFIEIGKQKNYIQILNGGTTIHYIAPDKKYRFSDPEEKVRAGYYVELIERYQYPETRISLEVKVPKRTPSDFADLVIFQDDDKQIPYIVIECKKDGISEAEFDQAIVYLCPEIMRLLLPATPDVSLMSRASNPLNGLGTLLRIFRSDTGEFRSGDIKRRTPIGNYKPLK